MTAPTHRFAIMLALFAGAACSDTHEPELEVFVRLEPRSALITVGQPVEFTFSPAPVDDVPRLELRDSSLLNFIGPTRLAGAQPGETHALVRSAGGIDSVPVAVVDFEACPLVYRVLPSDVVMRTGDVLQFNVVGCGGVRTDFDFSSSSPAVLVSTGGLATAQSPGSAVITARSREDETHVATATVRVE